MPEGPEIRRAADRLARALVGRRVRRAFFAFAHLAPFEARLRGRRVEAVEPRGKALLTRFSGGLNVYSHNQLYGRWTVTRAGRTPSTRRSLRFALHNEDHSAWLHSASEIAVLGDDELEGHPFLAKLGPDVLAPGLTDRALAARLASDRFGRRRLGGLLLDQAFVAGLGNYLRSEILHVAGLHPERRPVDLEEDERRSLARAIRQVARRAYRTGGITNDAERVTELKARGWRRRAYRHLVFDRGGEACWGCGIAIERVSVASRKLFLCPSCQPARRPRRRRRASARASRAKA